MEQNVETLHGKWDLRMSENISSQDVLCAFWYRTAPMSRQKIPKRASSSEVWPEVLAAPKLHFDGLVQSDTCKKENI